MAEMLDDVVEQDEIAAVEQKQSEVKQEVEVPKVSDEDAALPEKFRGKSKADLYEAYKNTEQALSRQGQELGEIRRLADELLKRDLEVKAEKEKPKEVDFFENPQEAISRAVSEHPDVVNARKYAVQATQEQARARVAQKHPDMAQIIQDGEFVEFVKASPVRMKLYQLADQQFDAEAADELFSTFKQIRSVRAAQATDLAVKSQETEKAARQKSITAASVDTGGTSESSKPIYRRSKLLEMQLRRPDEYRQLADSGELALAYTEGRVK